MSTVGAGIYGGSVQRDADGKIIIGAQYQNHNSRHGPVYDGKGYSLMSKAIQAGPEKVREVLQVSRVVERVFIIGRENSAH